MARSWDTARGTGGAVGIAGAGSEQLLALTLPTLQGAPPENEVTELPLLVEYHDGRARDGLRLGADPEDRVPLHRLARLAVGHAPGVEPGHLPASHDHGDRGGDAAEAIRG